MHQKNELLLVRLMQSFIEEQFCNEKKIKWYNRRKKRIILKALRNYVKWRE